MQRRHHYALPVRFARRLAALSLGVVAMVSGACGGSGSGTTASFPYDDSAPLEVVDAGIVNTGYPVAVHDVTYSSADDLVEAYVIVPPGPGEKPAVLYLHPARSDRTLFLEAALWLAARGVVTMTITAPSIGDPPNDLPPREALDQFERQIVRDVVAARRALDVLTERTDVDSRRLGVVGWSAGGRAAALLAGADPRVRAAVLLAPGAAPVSEFVEAAPAELRAAVEETMSRIDPFTAIARSEADLLVQAGRRDSVVPERAIEALVSAAPDGVELRWYDADHALNDHAYRDHLDWLSGLLSVDGPAVSGARTGP